MNEYIIRIVDNIKNLINKNEKVLFVKKPSFFALILDMYTVVFVNIVFIFLLIGLVGYINSEVDLYFEIFIETIKITKIIPIFIVLLGYFLIVYNNLLYYVTDKRILVQEFKRGKTVVNSIGYNKIDKVGISKPIINEILNMQEKNLYFYLLKDKINYKVTYLLCLKEKEANNIYNTIKSFVSKSRNNIELY